jgi:hypothetical protein
MTQLSSQNNNLNHHHHENQQNLNKKNTIQNTKYETKQPKDSNSKKVDSKRIFLTNIPKNLEQEYLEIYLEYLSNEIEIESVHLGGEIKNSILVTYTKNISKNKKHFSF